MPTKLTDTQTAILRAAARRPDGNLEPLPPALRGGARAKVIDGLLARELITKFRRADHVEYYVTDAGFAAVGRKRKSPAPAPLDPELKAAATTAEAKRQQDAVTKRDATNGAQNLDTISRPVRPGSKLAVIIDAMRRRGGATIVQMMAGTGWQAHTVRGAISGMIRKKLGYSVLAEWGTDGQRIYHIA